MVNNILKIVPLVQSAQLLKYNAKKLNKKKIGVKDIFGLGVTNITAGALIKAEREFINGPF